MLVISETCVMPKTTTLKTLEGNSQLSQFMFNLYYHKEMEKQAPPSVEWAQA